VPLDTYKTQVLLLHSEPSTLDALSAGFNDRYTVHLATSGSEALNTLGETPINVIISAHKLPGMSGLEALREAKKRSPETIGILLAGSSDTGLEALVGDKEVFQVVRGNVTADGLRKLVDNATRQMRLMALAESANDTAANPDEPAAEHIIMETSENGSTIISDGTGRFPAVDPKKIPAAAAVGSQAVDVLVLTKDQEFLTTIKESSRGMHTVHYANTLSQADDIIRKFKVGVAVVDAAMVGDKVEQLTLHLRKGSARLVSIVAGRRDDGEMLMDLINRGKVYRFLLKPVSPGRARLAVEASVKHHLEAPDTAFKIKDSGPVAKPAAAKPAPQPAPKPAPRPAAKPAPSPAAKSAPTPRPAPAAPPKAAPGPAARSAPKPAAASPMPPRDPPLGVPQQESPIDRGLSDAFGDDDARFAETVTNLLGAFKDKLSQKKEPVVQKPVMPVAAASDSGPGWLKNKVVLGAAGAVVVACVAGAFWLFSGEDSPVETVQDVPIAAPQAAEARTSVTESDVVLDAPVKSTAADVDLLVAEARLARDAGQIFNPAGNNAIELYAAAVAASPENAVIATELNTVLEQALTMAETGLLESRFDDVAAALDRVGAVAPGNVRLPFLTAQLNQAQLRSHVSDARSAIRETRFEDAGRAIAAARALGVASKTEIDALADELQKARSEQKVDEVLALANARLEEGDLVSPANDNARYYFGLVLSNDPQNVAALQGMNVVASKLVLQARSEIDQGNLNDAEDILAAARALDTSNTELAAAEVALLSARDALAAEQRAAEARRRAAEQQAAADRKARADAEAAAQREAEMAAAREADAASAVTEPVVSPASEAPATVAGKPGAAETTVPAKGADAGEVAAESTAAAATPEPAADEPIDVRDQQPVSISSLNRVKYVSPKYPRAAQRRNQSGWVDVVFTVSEEGTVKDLVVRDSEPGDLFIDAALKAVEQWEFEPIVEDGQVVEKRAGVRMMFALE